MGGGGVAAIRRDDFVNLQSPTGLPTRWKARLIMVGLVAGLGLGGPDPERLGTTYQYALPIMALGCALTNGKAADFAVRYAVQLALVHGPKNLLGDTPMNRRPNGGLKGMPSGHTATATLGASNLVHDCLSGHPLAQGAVILTAGFVGASRIETGAHTIWQVLAGALVGWLCDRAFRGSAARLRRRRTSRSGDGHGRG